MVIYLNELNNKQFYVSEDSYDKLIISSYTTTMSKNHLMKYNHFQRILWFSQGIGIKL